MKREGYYGLLLALVAIAVIYYLNKAGLLHNSQYSLQDDAATLKEMAGTTATVSATVGGVPVGSETTVYPKSTLKIGGEFTDTAPVSQALRWGSNLF